MIKKVRGTQDILDLRLRNFIIGKMREHLALYNFNQIQTPILEHTELFQHSLGTQTDVVSKEMYTFTTEGGENLCLRPEITASTFRAFLESSERKTPWQVFSIGQAFRHERPQKGRWREFSQINIEAIGTKAIEHDAHFLYMLDSFFSEKLSLENFVLDINFLGTIEDRKSYREKLYSYVDQHADSICKTCTIRKEKNLLRVFDCKNEICKELYEKAPLLTDHLSTESQKEWEQLQTTLDMLSVSRNHNPCLVRGLDYYEKTVFEFSSMELGSQNAFCGGGRWNLSAQFASKTDYPSLGAAIGVGRLLMLLEKIQDQLTLPQPPALNIIIPITEEQKTLALLLAQTLHQKDVCVDILFSFASIGNMMQKANKMGAKNVLILGPEEQAAGTVVIKNMITGKQETVAQVEAFKHLI